MSTKSLNVRLRHAIRTESEWQSSDPVLMNGELAFTSDKGLFKIGNGSSKWSELSYNLANSLYGLTASIAELNYMNGVKSNVQTQLDSKAPLTHAHDEYINQNTFSNIIIDSTTITADSQTDTLSLVAGDNVTLTPDVTNNKITISAKDTTYNPAGSSLGLVKSGGDVTISDGVITIKDDSHNHIISNIDGLQSALDGKVPTTRMINGKALSSNITLSASDIGADTSGSASSALASAKAYTDTHIKNADVHITSDERTKLSGIASGAEINQNAFSKVVIDSTTISADTKTDTLTLVAGDNITLTPDATNDKITIVAKDTTYNAAGTALGLVKSGGDVTISNGVITVKDDSHNHTIANVDNLQTELNKKLAIRPQNWNYNNLGSYYCGSSTPTYIRITFAANMATVWTMLYAEISIRQLYSSNLAGKLYISGMHNNVSPYTWTLKCVTTATLSSSIKVYAKSQYIYIAGISSYGGISVDKVLTGDTINSTDLSSITIDTVTALPDGYSTAVMVNTLTTENVAGGASTIINDNLTASRVLISNSNGKVVISDITTTELGYLDGVTSNLQTQLNGKQATITGGASTITGSNLTASRTLISNGLGKVAVSSVTSTELGYLSGVTSAIQTQLNNRVNINSGMGQNLNNYSCTNVNTISGTKIVYSSSTATGKPTGTDHSLFQMAYSDLWKTQLAQDWRTNTAYIRNCNNGTWGSWYELITSGNIASQSVSSATSASKWATARTITLSGDVTGSVSIDGSANVTLTTTVGNDSHTHGYLTINNTETKNVGRLQMFQVSNNSTLMPDTGWWSLLRTQHAGYTNGYWQEMAYSFGSDIIKFRRNVNGTLSAWKTIAFTDSSITGNSATATQLKTSRKINGTAFNGTADITTANWGTARTVTIGATGKSVNGSGNVSWTHDELGVPKVVGSYAFGGNSNAITTADFITLLTDAGAFKQRYWITRGSWAYANNQYISDTGCGNIHLAGCTVEVISSSSSAYTIRVHAPTTSSKGETNADWIYVNNGAGYSPGWRRLYSNKYKPSADKWTTARTITLTGSVTGSVSIDGSGNVSLATTTNHTHSYLPLSGGIMSGNITLPADKSIIQNQAATSNYTTLIKWYKNSKSQATYDPQIGQHNTGGDGTGSITILPYATETSPWGGTVGLCISKGSAKLDGNTLIHAGNYTSYTVTKTGSGASGSWGISITGNAATSSSAVKWSTARNINGMSVDGSANRVNYGTCSTAAATAAKVVACTGFALITGSEITVKFTVTNTASSPTLNVNSTGAKAIYYRGSAITAGYLAANRTYTFRYNGTQYELVGDINTDNNTDTKVTQTISSTSNANYRILLSGTADDTTRTEGVRKDADFYYNPSTNTLKVGTVNGTATNSDKLNGYARGELFTSIPNWMNTTGLTKSITVTGDANTYYPVVISVSASKEAPVFISVWKNLGSTTPSITGNHSNGTSSMWLQYEARNIYWDGNGGYLKTWYRYMGYAELCSNASMLGSGVGNLCLWLRGGTCSYNVSCTNTFSVTAYYSKTNLGSSDYPVNVSPRTDIGNKGLLSTAVLGYGNIVGNADTATKLATARTFRTNLGSTSTASFDGSANVTPGVTGTLPVANGGTGGTTAATARGNLGAMSATLANSYYGMGTPDGTTSAWIRTTSLGIIPYQSGGAGSGHCGIGTSSWYFSTAYIDTVYGSLSGNASSATKVYSTLTNPTSVTNYYIPFHSTASSANKDLRNNNGFYYRTLEGTTSANGYGLLCLGNSTASGTAGNKYGGLLIYGTGAYYTQLSVGTPTANRTITFPNATGTVVLLDASQALTNKTYNGYTLAAACAKGVTDSTSASAISTGANLVTERDVYYGLPTINGAHTYTSSTNIYAPTSVGTSGYVLKSGGSGAPSWVAQSTLSVGSATNASKVYVTSKNPTSATTYWVPFMTGSTGSNNNLLANNGYGYRTLEGTASANGYGILVLGNSASSGTAGNKYGSILAYGTKNYYTQLNFGTQTANRTITFPNASGTVALTSDLNKLSLKGTNTISSTTNDTVANWKNQLNSVHWYNTSDKINNQPSQYGYLLNLTVGNADEVGQIWLTAPNGDMAHRGGNASGWNGTWKTVLDSSNYSSYALPKTGGTMSGTITSSIDTATWLNGNRGKAIINSSAGAGYYAMLAKMNSTNGYFTHGVYKDHYCLYYTSKSTVDAGTNAFTYEAWLLGEDGGTWFPGFVKAGTGGSFIQIGGGEYDVYIHNPKSGKFLQLRDDGRLGYDNEIVPVVRWGTGNPDNSWGKDGDIYIKY